MTTENKGLLTTVNVEMNTQSILNAAIIITVAIIVIVLFVAIIKRIFRK